ncbi:MAG: hypothetical protein NZ518_07035 [Dehalococcoidia bacterium]|nr:hypothetical protein [Dehalococcoidia bacterium]
MAKLLGIVLPLTVLVIMAVIIFGIGALLHLTHDIGGQYGAVAFGVALTVIVALIAWVMAARSESKKTA